MAVNPQGTDPDNDPLTTVIVRPPTQGKLVMEGTGYRYIPKVDFNGSDSFEFLVNDGYQDSARVTSNITVTVDPLGLAPAPVTAMARSGNEILGLTVNGENIVKTRLQTGTLSSFIGAVAGVVLSANGSTPSTGSQALGYISDYLFDTGLINPAVSDSAITLTFSPPLVNGPGPDLVVLEINATSPADPFQARINSVTRTVGSYGNTGVTTSNATVSSTRNTGNTADSVVTSLSGLSAAPLRVSSTNISQPVYGVALNFSNFGVAEGGSVSSIQLGSNTGTNFDPVFVAGIVPANQPPVAVATPTPNSGTAPLSVTWSGTGSSDADGSIVSYAWTFSDGGTATGPTVNRSYAQPGTYSATLTVSDNVGATASHTASVTVQSATTSRGTPISWLIGRFGSSTDYDLMEATDHDGDGQATWMEYRAGTDPENASDAFRILRLTVNQNGSVTLEWRGSSENGVTTPFRVMGTSDLSGGGWQVRAESVPRASSGNTIWTDSSPPAGGRFFYRIEAP